MTISVSIGVDAVLIVATGGAVIITVTVGGVRFPLWPLGGAVTITVSIGVDAVLLVATGGTQTPQIWGSDPTGLGLRPHRFGAETP